MKRLGLLAILALFLAIPVNLLRAQTQKSASPIWVKEESKHPYFSEVYRLQLPLGTTACYVNMHTDGRGATVVARDKERDKDGKEVRVLQQINIRRGEAPIDTRFATTTDKLPDSVNWLGYQIRINGGENEIIGPYNPIHLSPETDIFRTKFLAAAKSLPPEVQKLFFGEYGLGEKPQAAAK